MSFQNTSLSFSYYNFDKIGYTQIPPPPPNAGLYTGELFKQNSAWSNIYITPTSENYVEVGLDHGKRVPNSQFEYINHTRQGNNLAVQKNIAYVDSSKYTIMCANYQQNPCTCSSPCDCNKCFRNM